MQVEGGDGDNVSLITKSPSWSRATPVELVEEPGPQLVIVLLQKSWAWTTWPPFDPITFVLVSSKPIPLTQMCPPVSTSALSSLIVHGPPPGFTPHTTLVPDSGSTPIPPRKKTSRLLTKGFDYSVS